MKQYLLFYSHPLQLPTKLFYPLCLNFQGFFLGGGGQRKCILEGTPIKSISKNKETNLLSVFGKMRA